MSPATIKRKYVCIYIARCGIEVKKYSFAYGLLYTYRLAEEVVTTDKSLRSFSASVSVA